MKMGAAAVVLPFFLISLALLLLLLLSVASARSGFTSVIAKVDAEGNRLSMEDAIMDLYEVLAKTTTNHEDEISSNIVGSSTPPPTDHYFTVEACLEISRKAKEGVKDQSIINEMDSLASAVCYIFPSHSEAELRANGSCAVCRGILDGIGSVLGNTDKQLVIILYLIKACKIQTFADQCKKMVFTFGPAILTGVKELVSNDLCHTVKICGEARNVTEYAASTSGRFGHEYLQSELGNLADLLM